jgi:hypothetical protein
MIIYSVTVQLPRELAPEWLSYMREEHIPDVMAAGYFLNYHIQRILDPVVDITQATYNIQYECESLTAYDKYQRLAAPALQKAHADRYGDQTTAFRTVLERL